MTEDDFDITLCRVINDCCRLYKRKNPADYLYTQAVIMMTLCEQDFQGVDIPQTYRDTVKQFKNILAAQDIKKTNAAALPDNEDDLKELLLALQDSDFVKA